jgi:hypothetical protein
MCILLILDFTLSFIVRIVSRAVHGPLNNEDLSAGTLSAL